MKKLIISTSFLMSVAALSAFGASMTGFVADSSCAAKGKGGQEAHADCAARCIKGGAAPVLVVGDKVYKIKDSDKDKVTSFAGKQVTVEGTVDGDTVSIESVK